MSETVFTTPGWASSEDIDTVADLEAKLTQSGGPNALQSAVAGAADTYGSGGSLNFPFLTPESQSGWVSTPGADNSAALQAAINAAGTAGAGTILLQPGKEYSHASTLNIAKDCVAIYSPGQPNFGRWQIDDPVNWTGIGARLKYTGTGVQMVVGKQLSVNGSGVVTMNGRNHIHRVTIEGVRFEASATARSQLILYHAHTSTVSKCTFVGPKGNDALGLVRIYAGIGNKIRDCDIDGGGIPVAGSAAGYAMYGMDCLLGFGNDTITTTSVENTYIHYCQNGARTTGQVTFDNDSIFEACGVGLVQQTNAYTRLGRCWFEANLTTDVFFGAGSRLYAREVLFNAYGRQTFFDGAGFYQAEFEAACEFYSDHASPKLFSGSTGLDSNVSVTDKVLGSISAACVLPNNCTVGGYLDIMRADRFKMVGLSIVEHVFKATLNANSPGVLSVNSLLNQPVITAAQQGQIIGLQVYAGAALSAGSYLVYVNRDQGGGAANVTDLNSTGVTSRKFVKWIPHLEPTGRVNPGDEISVYMQAVGATNPYNEFTISVFVAYGRCGRGLLQ